MRGILNPINGALMDPGTMGLLQTGLGLMAAGGPSRLPVSIGQALGQAGMQGLGGAYQAQHAGQQQQQMLMRQRVLQAQLEQQQREEEERARKAEATRSLLGNPQFAPYAQMIAAGLPLQHVLDREMPKAKTPEPFTLKPGEARYDASGNLVVSQPATERTDPLRAPPKRERIEGGVLIQEELQPDMTWREVGRGPRFKPSDDKERVHPVVGVDANGNQVVNWASPSQGTRTFQTKPPSLTTSTNQQALALRRSYDASPEVRLANALEPRVGPMAQYVAEVGKNMGNSVGDAELVKLWLMTTHPKGDQISNLDYRAIEKMPDLWGRVKNMTGNFVFGKTLDSETRASMWRSISEKWKATAAERKKRRDDAIGRGRNMGISEDLIFGQQQE